MWSDQLRSPFVPYVRNTAERSIHNFDSGPYIYIGIFIIYILYIYVYVIIYICITYVYTHITYVIIYMHMHTCIIYDTCRYIYIDTCFGCKTYGQTNVHIAYSRAHTHIPI